MGFVFIPQQGADYSFMAFTLFGGVGVLAAFVVYKEFIEPLFKKKKGGVDSNGV